jgi:hypothetical protein
MDIDLRNAVSLVWPSQNYELCPWMSEECTGGSETQVRGFAVVSVARVDPCFVEFIGAYFFMAGRKYGIKRDRLSGFSSCRNWKRIERLVFLIPSI